jgi:hypothetical protein
MLSRSSRSAWFADTLLFSGAALMRAFLPLLIGGIVWGSLTAAHAEETDWQKVDDALGRKPASMGDVRRYAFPRGDLNVTLDGVTIKPALALGGWIAFKPTRGESMIMGDFVLLESEVAPVVAKLLEGGVEVTAVHNHLLRATPMPIYVHVGGAGDPIKLAATIRGALSLSKTPMTAAPTAAPAPAVDLDTTGLDEIVGAQGKAVGGVYQFSIPRRGQIIENGMQLNPPGPTGVATVINFQPTGAGKAAITGDFVLIGEEATPVLQALRLSGIEVTALHSHMLTEQPRLLYLHFWANDDARKLAKGLRAALDKVDVGKN